jgi:hypothetical protein
VLAELLVMSPKVRRYIILHDTQSFGGPAVLCCACNALAGWLNAWR